MSKISRDKVKQRGFKRFLRSFKFSVEGLEYAYKYEQSMFIHFLVTVGVVILNLILKVDVFIWLITLLAVGMVLASELINTAIEAVVDLVTLEIHPLAKIAKDCGSAATFVLSIMAGALGIIVYLPLILNALGV